MSDAKITHRDYLQFQIALALSALAEGMRIASETDDEGFACNVLETKMDTARVLLKSDNPNPDRVEPKPPCDF